MKPGRALRGRCLGAVLGTILLAAPGLALAANVEHVQAALDAGDFATAAAAGSEDGSAEGLTLAAQAALAEAGSTGDQAEVRQNIDRAVELGRAAVKAAPNDVMARLSLAAALGAAARSMNTMAAQDSGLIGEARSQIDAALALDPGSGLALAARASWHAQIIGRVGAVMAMATYGASQPVAFEDLARAVELEPHNLLIRFEFARSILNMRGMHGADDARQTLEGVVAAVPRGGLERLVQGTSRGLLQALATDDDEALERLLKWPYAEPPARENSLAGGPVRDD